MACSIGSCVVLALVTSVTALACGGNAKPAAIAQPTRSRPEDITAHMCTERAKISMALRPDTKVQSTRTSQAAAHGTIGSETPLIAQTDPRPFQFAFARVAPATVIVKTASAFGSGIIVDKSGLILTNYHVVEAGRQPDFTIKVSIEFGRMTTRGRVVRTEKSYGGYVIKADAVRDLALVRVENPPEDLPSATLAKTDPSIGEQVLAVGQAGLGLLWAGRACHVAQVGDYTTDTSFFTGVDCTIVDPTDTPEEAKRQSDECEERKKHMKEQLQGGIQGLTVQTTCGIMPGDSGGPLVNASGELVGVNQSIRREAAFHVHIAEVRDFLAQIPDARAQRVPDVWCDGGASDEDALYEDLDGDGTKESLVVDGGIAFGHKRKSMSKAGAFFLDLNQDNANKKPSDAMPFDAEIAVLAINERTYVYYDTNDDDRFDLLLVDRKGEGKVDEAYRLGSDGKWVADSAIKGGKLLDPVYVQNTYAARIGAFARMIGQEKGTAESALAAARALGSDGPLPDMLTGGGTDGRVMDVDNDQAGDLVMVEGPLGYGALVDTSGTLAGLKSGDRANALLEEHKLRPQFAFIVRGSTRYAMYDTNHDGKPDLVLTAPGGRAAEMDPDGITSNFAYDAFRLTDGAKRTPAPEFLGQRLILPALYTDTKVARVMKQIPIAEGASDDGMSTLPDPEGGDSAMRGFDSTEFLSLLGKSRAAIQRKSHTGTVVLIDLDQNSKRAMSESAEAVLAKDAFDAELSYVAQGSARWVFYDTDNDGRFDLVLFSAHRGSVDNAFRLDTSTGKVHADRTEVHGDVWRNTGVFKDPALAKLWSELFPVLLSELAHPATPGPGVTAPIPAPVVAPPVDAPKGGPAHGPAPGHHHVPVAPRPKKPGKH